MPEKAVYTLTDSGHHQFEKLMMELSCKPINIFLDFNAVIVNLDSLSRENQKSCLTNIENNVKTLKSYLEENMNLKKMFPKFQKQEWQFWNSNILLHRQSKHGLRQ